MNDGCFFKLDVQECGPQQIKTVTSLAQLPLKGTKHSMYRVQEVGFLVFSPFLQYSFLGNSSSLLCKQLPIFQIPLKKTLVSAVGHVVLRLVCHPPLINKR